MANISKIQIESGTYDIKDEYIRNKETTDFNNLNTKITSVERNAIYIGNSYTEGVGSTSGNDGIFKLTKNLFNNAYKFCGSGCGFLGHTDHTNDTFITHLQDAINDTSINKNSITDIIIIGAYGDSAAYHEFGKATFISNINSAVTSFTNLVETYYPNVSRICYLWAEGRKVQNPSMQYVSTLSDEFNIHNLFKWLLPRNKIEYLGWIGFNITLKDYYFGSDPVHPNDYGYKMLASCFKSAYNGNLTYNPIRWNLTSTCEITSGSSITTETILEPDKWILTFLGGTIKAGNTNVFNTEASLANFTSASWCLPIPFDTNLDFGACFKLQTTKAAQVTYDTNNEYVGKILVTKSSNQLSTQLKVLNVGLQRTIAEDIGSPIIAPLSVICNLEYR